MKKVKVKYKLEIAKINAETTIRTEEIRARNQFQIEKLMEQEIDNQVQEKTGFRTHEFSEADLQDKSSKIKV